MRKRTSKDLKTKYKLKYDPTRVGILIIGSVVVLGVVTNGVSVGYAYIKNINKKEEVVDVIEDESATDVSNGQQIEEEKIVGVLKEFEEYSFDAQIIESKLSKYDSSMDGEKVVFLTFDDGTSKTVTPEILNILKEENVKATFFLTGNTIEGGGDDAKELVRRELREGHAIANHSYSHDYQYLYPNRTLNLENFINDFKKNEELLKSILGENFSTKVIRCPGGLMSWKGMDELRAYLSENDMASIDWNALNADAQGKKKSASELVEYAKETSKDKDMVVLLMHDTYGKEETAKALPEIIKYYKSNGYKFKTLV